jgi:hypothetical protein
MQLSRFGQKMVIIFIYKLHFEFSYRREFKFLGAVDEIRDPISKIKYQLHSNVSEKKHDTISSTSNSPSLHFIYY